MLFLCCRTKENSMEREIFALVRASLRNLGQRRVNGRFTYTDATIVAVYFWAVIHDRPVDWACRPGSWRKGMRRGRLPSQSSMSRRLRTQAVRRLIQRLEQRLLRRRQPALVYLIDGKPLIVGGNSRDPHAGFGRSAGGMAKGYKLHLLMDLRGSIWAWRVAPMNGDERTMARRLLPRLPQPGYVLADSNYDSSKLHLLAASCGAQLVAPRRGGPDKGVWNRARNEPRLRSKDMLECDMTGFGPALYRNRTAIERRFGAMTTVGGGLSLALPAWVRTHQRVKAWVQAKLIIYAARMAVGA
jgi:hypothetical protein